MKNFHAPLAESRLCRSQGGKDVPATTLAREAVDWWLRLTSTLAWNRPRWIGAEGPSSRNRRVARRLQPNSWMEVDYRDPDLNIFIARQARTYRH